MDVEVDWTKLPSELILAVLAHLDVQSLCAARLSCSAFRGPEILQAATLSESYLPADGPTAQRRFPNTRALQLRLDYGVGNLNAVAALGLQTFAVQPAGVADTWRTLASFTHITRLCLRGVVGVQPLPVWYHLPADATIQPLSLAQRTGRADTPTRPKLAPTRQPPQKPVDPAEMDFFFGGSPGCESALGQQAPVSVPDRNMAPHSPPGAAAESEAAASTCADASTAVPNTSCPEELPSRAAHPMPEPRLSLRPASTDRDERGEQSEQTGAWSHAWSPQEPASYVHESLFLHALASLAANLRSLTLQNCPLSPAFSTALKSLVALTKLELPVTMFMGQRSMLGSAARGTVSGMKALALDSPLSCVLRPRPLLSLSGLSELRELSLSRQAGITHASLAELSKLCSLTSLDLSGCPHVLNSFLVEFGGVVGRLRHLDLSLDPSLDMNFELLDEPSAFQAVDVTFAAVDDVTCLTSLKLAGRFLVQPMLSMLVSMTGLRSLDLCKCEILSASADTIRHFSRLQQLTMLGISYAMTTFNPNFEGLHGVLPDLPVLQCLDLGKADSFAMFQRGPTSQQFSALTRLDLSDVCNLHRSDILGHPCLAALQWLDLSDTGADTAFIIKMVAQMPALRYLDVSSNLLDSRVWEVLCGSRLPHVTRLSALLNRFIATPPHQRPDRNQPRGTQASDEDVADGAAMGRLSLRPTAHAEDSHSFIAAQLASLTTLVHLSLAGCNVLDAHLAGLSRLAALTQLELMDCAMLTRASVAVITHLPLLADFSLSFVDLRGSLPHVACARQLTRLALPNCNLRDDDVADLAPLSRVRVLGLLNSDVVARLSLAKGRDQHPNRFGAAVWRHVAPLHGLRWLGVALAASGVAAEAAREHAEALRGVLQVRSLYVSWGEEMRGRWGAPGDGDATLEAARQFVAALADAYGAVQRERGGVSCISSLGVI